MSLGDFFGSLSGKCLNATNTGQNLYCRTCKKSKPHTPISYGEAAIHTITSSEADLNISNALGRVFDYVPFVMPILGGNSYFCDECNRITYIGGLLSGSMAYDKEAFYYRP
jgi:hypothetical protein